MYIRNGWIKKKKKQQLKRFFCGWQCFALALPRVVFHTTVHSSQIWTVLHGMWHFIQGPSTFCLPFANTLYGLFSTWIHEINSKNTKFSFNNTFNKCKEHVSLLFSARQDNPLCSFICISRLSLLDRFSSGWKRHSLQAWNTMQLDVKFMIVCLPWWVSSKCLWQCWRWE